MYLLIPGRHHLISKFQQEHIQKILSSSKIDGIIWAITSSNHQFTRRNPLPGHRREAQLELLGRQFDIPSYIFHIEDLGVTPNFAHYILQKITVDSLSQFTLTPQNSLVLTSTPSIISQFKTLGFTLDLLEQQPNNPNEYITPRPYEIIEKIAANEQVEVLCSKTSLDFYQKYQYFDLVRDIFADPLLGDDGDLTDTRDYNVYVRAFDEGAIRKYKEVQKYLKPGKIVDIGCATGSILKQMSEDVSLTESDLYGIEISRKLISLCEQRKQNGEFSNNNVFFYHRNIATKPLFENNTIDIFTTFSLTHELVSYDSQTTLIKFLQNIYSQLRPSGRYINLDVVGPENKSQVVLAQLNYADGHNPADITDLTQLNRADAKSYLENLSTYSRFIQFAHDFRPDQKDRLEYQEVVEDGVKHIKTSMQNISEFLSKKDYLENWLSEMHETFCFWSFTDWKQKLEEIGFTLHQDSRSFQNEWIIQNRYKNKVSLFDVKTKKPLDYPPTNILLIAQK